MKTIFSETWKSVVATLSLSFLLCGVYPVVVWALAQGFFPSAANGSLIEKDGVLVGSRLIGQNFSAPVYFHSRPSAAGKGYDAASSSGSNLGPISQKFLDAVAQRAAEYRKENAMAEGRSIPADAVTASGSGLDPHISPSNAAIQLTRVAKERGMTEDAVRALVDRYTEGPDLGFLGDAGVNVLELNLALDAATHGPSH